MNLLFILPLLSAFLSCNKGEPKFLRKKIENKEITITWYYHSYITNNSPDFVVVEKGDSTKEIYKATEVILDVTLKERDIVLKLVEPSKGLVFTREKEKEVFGYNVVLDTTGTYDELRLRPDGVKEKNW